jgi:hypothetical protein
MIMMFKDRSTRSVVYIVIALAVLLVIAARHFDITGSDFTEIAQRYLDRSKPLEQQAVVPNIAVRLMEAPQDHCVSDEKVQTMSTRWASVQAPNAKQFEFVNTANKAVFIKLFADAKAKEILETVLVLPGESIREPVLRSQSVMELSTGANWCNRLKGWVNGEVTKVTGFLNGGSALTRVQIGNAPGSDLLAVKIVHLQPKTEVQPSFTAIPQPVFTSSTAQPQGRVLLQPSQGAIAMQQQRELAASQELAMRGAIEAANRAHQQQAAHLGAVRQVNHASYQETAAPINVRVQDWRDVPPRDIRLVTNGSRHYVGGKIGEEDVQFEIQPHSYSVISERAASEAGASGCRNGSWLILGRYFSTCQKLIPSLRFGSVELENVMVAVLPGNQRPILGFDLIGQARIFEGHDGNYLSVGR